MKNKNSCSYRRSVWKSRGLFALALTFLALIPSYLRAQDTVLCLERAAQQIKPDDRIILIGNDRSSISGRLVGIDLYRSTLTISRIINNEQILSRYNRSELREIRFQESRKIKPLYGIIGMIAGGLVGGQIAAGSNMYYSTSHWFEHNFGAVMLGGLIGGAMGIGISVLAPPPSYAIHCK